MLKLKCNRHVAILYHDMQHSWRKSERNALQSAYSELEAKMFTQSDGIYLRDIVGEKMETDDARLQ